MSAFSITIKNNSSDYIKGMFESYNHGVGTSGPIAPKSSQKMTFSSSACNNTVLNELPETIENLFSFARTVCAKSPQTLSGEFSSKGIKGFYYGINSKIPITNGGTYEYSNGKFSLIK